jgi:D-amino-acid dehydrogenase
MKAIIIGSGIIGISTAYFLAKSGHEVTIIDKGDIVAGQTSFANGGQLSYAHAEPITNPRVFGCLLDNILGKEAVVDVKWQKGLFAWGMNFLYNSRPAKTAESLQALFELGDYSRAMMHEILSEVDIDFAYQRAGILHIFRNKKLFAKVLRAAHSQPMKFVEFDQKACMEKEPLLQGSGVIGGLYYPDDESGNAQVFASGLRKILQEKYKVKFLLNQQLEKVEIAQGKITKIITDKGALLADNFVLACGVQSGEIARKIGINIPMQPIKGYSLTFAGRQLSVGLTDIENKVVYSGLGNSIRAAGIADIYGFDYAIDPQRLGLLKKKVQELLPNLAVQIDQAKEWTGLRPVSNDALPIISATKFSNLFVNTAHGTLGWTLSSGSGKLIADIINKGYGEIATDKFAVARF